MMINVSHAYAISQVRDMIPHLVQLMTNSKAPGVRLDVARYLHKVLELRPKKSLQKHDKLLEKVFHAAVNDANNEVREIGKDMHILFIKHWGEENAVRCDEKKVLETKAC